MIYKVYYQETKIRNPKREETQSLYIEASSDVEARQKVEEIGRASCRERV